MLRLAKCVTCDKCWTSFFENMRKTKAQISLRIRSVERVNIINLKNAKHQQVFVSEHVGLSLTFSEYSRDAANEHL